MTDLRWGLLWENLPFLLEAVPITFAVSLLSLTIGVAIGWVSGLLSVSRVRVLEGAVWCYVQIFRGTPMLVQILLVYFGLPALGLDLSAFAAGTIALSLNTGAYCSEIVRGAIESIDKGQTDAAESLALTRRQHMTLILLPQAVRRAIPGLTNEMVTVVKSSSLLAVIGMAELTHSAQILISKTFAPFEFYIGISLMYLVMTGLISVAAKQLERRLVDY